MGSGIYICYARKDAKTVSRIVEVLWNTVQNTIWFDQEAIIEAEEEYKRRIDESEFFVFIASKNAFKSVWCMQELLYANGHGKKIIIIYLEDCRPNLDSVVARVVLETESIRYYLISDEQMAEEFQNYVSKKGRGLKQRSVPTEADLTYDIFISYRRGEATLETKIVYEHLTKEGYAVFLDKDEIHSGKWQEIIRNSIYNCKDFLLFLTPTALDSENVRNEVKWALEREKHITLVFVTPDYKFPENLPEDIVSIQDYNAIKWLPDEINAKLFSLKNDFLISKPREGMNQEIDEQRITRDKPEAQIITHEFIERKLDDCEFDEVKELIGNPETNLQFRGAPDSEKGRMYKYLLWAERGMRWSDDLHKALVEPFYGPNYNAACRYGYKEELDKINEILTSNIHDFIEKKMDLSYGIPYEINDPAECNGDYRYLWECILFKTQNLTCFRLEEPVSGYRKYSINLKTTNGIRVIASFIDEFRKTCPKWLYSGRRGLTHSNRYREFISRFYEYARQERILYKKDIRGIIEPVLWNVGNFIVLVIAILLQVRALLFGWDYFHELSNKGVLSNVCMYLFFLGILLHIIVLDRAQIRHFRRFCPCSYTEHILFATAVGTGFTVFGLICCALPLEFRVMDILNSMNKWYSFIAYLMVSILSAYFASRAWGPSPVIWDLKQSQEAKLIEQKAVEWRRDVL